MRPRQHTLTAERLREVLSYNPETGAFTNRVTRSPRAIKGSVAGCTRKSDGYIKISIDRKDYRAHILAYLYMTGEWPVDQIDHVNRDRVDNRWENLRDATNSQNQANAGIRRDNTSGAKGVYWDRAREKWAVQINVKGTHIYLGRFTDVEDAAAAYAVAADRYFGEYARAA